MLVAEANSSGARMGVKQDLDGTPDHSAGKTMMDRMMQGRRKQQWQTGTSMVDEDAAEVVALPDFQQWIARCQVAEGDTCQPIAIGKESPNAWQQVVGGNTSPVQPMPEGHHIDLPDSLHPADPLTVPTTIKRGHKQEDSKCKLPIPSMIPMHQTGIDNVRGM
ncbi:hypothetical protein F5J12DRAFT_783669 [Pisolithus orientalis]|uniref:uncharacterized protein n=1 Tax=Pisolithus orientalis TaxID=936130 RepID=UPI002224CD68|nr:uncharacterized protein F5J12DRAFT_783669 [Pisolithus orientalis]KAI6003238.1 hypothetical protein F5J12DRAFT_783669 [Pisolithus orientalis]